MFFFLGNLQRRPEFIVPKYSKRLSMIPVYREPQIIPIPDQQVIFAPISAPVPAPVPAPISAPIPMRIDVPKNEYWNETLYSKRNFTYQTSFGDQGFSLTGKYKNTSFGLGYGDQGFSLTGKSGGGSFGLGYGDQGLSLSGSYTGGNPITGQYGISGQADFGDHSWGTSVSGQYSRQLGPGTIYAGAGIGYGSTPIGSSLMGQGQVGYKWDSGSIGIQGGYGGSYGKTDPYWAIVYSHIFFA